LRVRHRGPIKNKQPDDINSKRTGELDHTSNYDPESDPNLGMGGGDTNTISSEHI